jgi:hypothetical protein
MTDTPIDWQAEVRRHLRRAPITAATRRGIVEEIAQDLDPIVTLRCE